MPFVLRCDVLVELEFTVFLANFIKHYGYYLLLRLDTMSRDILIVTGSLINLSSLSTCNASSCSSCVVAVITMVTVEAVEPA